jgi:type II secretory pathway pseudopilin PulG
MSTWSATNSGAYTIIELLIVMIIIGMLITLSGLQITSSRRRARDAKRIADLSEYAQAVEQSAQLTGGRYPLPGTSVTGVSCAHEIIFASGMDKRLFNNSIIPRDPRPFEPEQAGCISATMGYRYHSQYNNAGTSEAVITKRAFVLETLLEEERTADDATIQLPADLGSPSSALQSGRYRYFISGKWCGTTDPCYK